MAYISSKFNITNYGNSGFANEQGWADDILTKLATAFHTANSAWEQVGSIETIGTNTNVNYPCRTIQLHSTASGGRYVRIWFFSGSSYTTFVNSPDTSGGYSNLKLYKGNIFKGNNGQYTNETLLGEDRCIYYAVSDSTIDVDFAKDLGLVCPMFGITCKWCSMNSSKVLGYYRFHSYNTIFSVITDGVMFGVLFCNSYDNTLKGCVYAPDMIICANSGDNETDGAFFTMDDNFMYLGRNSNDYINVQSVYNAADGSREFYGNTPVLDNGKSTIGTAENATEFACTALKVAMCPYNYSGSTNPGVINGIGLKGWINPKYLRSVNNNNLQAGSKGTMYAGGDWLCTEAGTLLCWNISNSSPWVAA